MLLFHIWFVCYVCIYWTTLCSRYRHQHRIMIHFRHKNISGRGLEPNIPHELCGHKTFLYAMLCLLWYTTWTMFCGWPLPGMRQLAIDMAATEPCSLCWYKLRSSGACDFCWAYSHRQPSTSLISYSYYLLILLLCVKRRVLCCCCACATIERFLSSFLSAFMIYSPHEQQQQRHRHGMNKKIEFYITIIVFFSFF